MIVTRQKDFGQIKEKLKSLDRILIIGCEECAKACETGGKKELFEMKEKLEAEGKTITGIIPLQIGCDERIVKKTFAQFKEDIASSDCFLALTCGSGVSTISDVCQKRIISGLDTLFMGKVKRFGVFHDRCRMCGECIIDRTAGICVVTRCPKSLLNGPCGGSMNGKCEVDREKDCAWAKVWERKSSLEKSGPKNHIIKPSKFEARKR